MFSAVLAVHPGLTVAALSDVGKKVGGVFAWSPAFTAITVFFGIIALVVILTNCLSAVPKIIFNDAWVVFFIKLSDFIASKNSIFTLNDLLVPMATANSYVGKDFFDRI